jgi:hypothetical protein
MAENGKEGHEDDGGEEGEERPGDVHTKGK